MTIHDLGNAVAHRRAELNLTQIEVAARGGPSAGTIAALEHHDISGASKSTLVKLDAGLSWPNGTAARIYSEGSPGAAIIRNLVPQAAGQTATRDRRAALRETALRMAVDTNVRYTTDAEKIIQTATRFEHYLEHGTFGAASEVV
ncbi:helix-turn-helix DNA binding protein [Gordonia phage Lilbeanie]|uniref:Helix-turn-helix DNA binding protein n=1 Tax=Gordonia phage Lilbeanie TaxID=2794947 RepID=A0A7T1KSD5_9CAUD|nr:helix-turn-helix DNA binding protein [Gordonia phage Lilbeanie]QPO17142.1 helix-turn-helix DNA binding protein [Gordonia phage Lilbeanie]